MKYSQRFIDDVKWYMSNRHNFSFSGGDKYFDKKGNNVVQYNKNGVSFVEAFYTWDSIGKIKPTRHPTTLQRLLQTKAAVNLQIKEWAQGRADGTLPGVEFMGDGSNEKRLLVWELINGQYEPVYYSNIVEYMKLPEWVINAVESQKYKYYERDIP